MSSFLPLPDRFVPSHITFSDRVMEFPTPEQEGIPELYASRGFYDRQTQYRSGNPAKCWIERGDPIIQAQFIVYSADEKPRGLFKARDATWTTTFVLESPISGLLVDARGIYCGYYSDSPQYTTSGHAGVYGTPSIWPVILIPNNEPPADNYNVEKFMHNLGTLAQQERSKFLCQSQTGPERLKYNGFDQARINAAEDMLKKYSKPLTGKPTTRKLAVNDRSILSHLQSLRKADVSLREKLIDAVRAIDPTDFA